MSVVSVVSVVSVGSVQQNVFHRSLLVALVILPVLTKISNQASATT